MSGPGGHRRPLRPGLRPDRVRPGSCGRRGDRADRVHSVTAETGGAVLAAALCGAVLALLPKRPHPRALTVTDLVLVAAGLTALDLAGLAAPSGRMLMLLSAPVAAGLACPDRLVSRGRPGRGAGRRGPPAGRPGGRLPGRGGGAAARAHRRHHGTRRACRPGDGGRTLDADGGGPRGNRRTGADLHRRAPERHRPRSRTQIRTQSGIRSRARDRTRKCHGRCVGPRGGCDARSWVS
jgi:hypothetical protein